YHAANATLTDLIDRYLVPPVVTPFVKRVTPESVLPTATDFYVQGKNFGATQGTSTVLFNGLAIPVVAWSNDLVHAYVPSSVTSFYGTLAIQTNQGTTNQKLLHVIQPPQVTSVSPSSGVVGTQIIIHGMDFGAYKGAVHFSFVPGSNNSGASTIVSWSDTVIKCIVPSDAASGYVTISTPYGNAVFSFVVTFKKAFLKNALPTKTLQR
ncbi:MAG: IPT/TIG domain-containing protein, partial [Candidatus Omnitrophota bacterium]